MESEDGCNALLLPTRNKKKRKANTSRLPKAKAPCLSKSQQRKLRRLQEEKEKKDKSVEVLDTLKKYKLGEDVYALLHASGTRGQRESMREKLRRALHYKRAGLEVPRDVPLLRERSVEDGLEEAETEFKASIKANEEMCFQAAFKRKTEIQAGNGHSGVSTKQSESCGGELHGHSKHTSKVQHTTRRPAIIDETKVGTVILGFTSSDLGTGLTDAKYGAHNDFSMEESSKAVVTLPSRKARKSSKECENANDDNSKKRKAAFQRMKKEKGKKLPEFINVDSVQDNV